MVEKVLPKGSRNGPTVITTVQVRCEGCRHSSVTEGWDGRENYERFDCALLGRRTHTNMGCGVGENAPSDCPLWPPGVEVGQTVVFQEG